MQVEELHYLLELQWNKLSNNQRVGLDDFEKDKLLNIAINDYFEIFGHGRNPKGFNLGFEVIQQRTDMLNTLIKEESINTTGSDSIWNITKPDNYGTYSTAKGVAKGCSNDINITIEQHGDKNSVLSDYHRKPSKKWGRAIGFEQGDIIKIHTDNQELTSVNLMYYKEPDEVCLGTYNDIPTESNPNPGIKSHSDTDLPDRYKDVVIKLALQNLAMIYENQALYTLSKDRQQTVY